MINHKCFLQTCGLKNCKNNLFLLTAAPPQIYQMWPSCFYVTHCIVCTKLTVQGFYYELVSNKKYLNTLVQINTEGPVFTGLKVTAFV